MKTDAGNFWRHVNKIWLHILYFAEQEFRDSIPGLAATILEFVIFCLHVTIWLKFH